MITCDFKDSSRDPPGLSTRLAAVLEWLKAQPLDSWENGTYPLPEELQGGHLYLKEAALAAREEVPFERHERHIDIHYCVTGEEAVGYVTKDDSCRPLAEAPPIDDHVFFEPMKDTPQLLLKPGMVVIFFPGDLHQPCCSTDSSTQVRKAVVKLPVTIG